MSMKTILCAMLAVGLSVSSAYAEPSVKRSGSTITVTMNGVRQEMELTYVRKRCIKMDLSILARTFGVMVRKTGK